MRIGKLRSIDYFSLSIGDGHDHRLYISLVLCRRGISFDFFERKEVTRELYLYANRIKTQGIGNAEI